MLWIIVCEAEWVGEKLWDNTTNELPVRKVFGSRYINEFESIIVERG